MSLFDTRNESLPNPESEGPPTPLQQRSIVQYLTAEGAFWLALVAALSPIELYFKPISPFPIISIVCAVFPLVTAAIVIKTIRRLRNSTTTISRSCITTIKRGGFTLEINFDQGQIHLDHRSSREKKRNVLLRVGTVQTLIESFLEHLPPEHNNPNTINESLKNTGDSVGESFGSILGPVCSFQDVKMGLDNWIDFDRRTGFAQIRLLNYERYRKRDDFPEVLSCVFRLDGTFLDKDSGANPYCSFFQGYIQAVLTRLITPDMINVAVEVAPCRSRRHYSCEFPVTIKFQAHQ